MNWGSEVEGGDSRAERKRKSSGTDAKKKGAFEKSWVETL